MLQSLCSSAASLQSCPLYSGDQAIKSTQAPQLPCAVISNNQDHTAANRLEPS
ncbi:hypothetical protein PGT21_032955 [Puccinia graminis f. sp. tritici]|uniref:Uncharacterized protein n=1 Tax=Puccinia graminis f. sp. tritici TaxID=56615 RepID=A0A5B0QQQ0_PUCGR|nr:hypothetical protein PGT21_032955 [Puccinia graminis f. sp. tritici]